MCARGDRMGEFFSVGFNVTYDGVHVEDPVEGVDLSEGWDLHGEAPVRENYSEHVDENLSVLFLARIVACACKIRWCRFSLPGVKVFFSSIDSKGKKNRKIASRKIMPCPEHSEYTWGGTILFNVICFTYDSLSICNTV